MKKVLAIMAIAGFMVACNNDSEKTESAAADSTRIADSTRVADSIAAAQKATMDSANKMNSDTTNKMK